MWYDKIGPVIRKQHFTIQCQRVIKRGLSLRLLNQFQQGISMAHENFIFGVNTLVGCKYSILRDLEKRHRIEKKFRKKFRRSKYISLITTGLSYFDNLRYRSISKNIEIRKSPIYVLGFWRSGTTFLHNLLCSFTNVSYPTTYQGVFPNNLFFLKGLINWIMQSYLPEKRLVDKVRMHVDFPQEEDIALANENGFSFYNCFFFPSDHQQIIDEILEISPDDEKKSQLFREHYKRFIKRCLLNVGGEQYIAKNPPSMARIPLLLDMFPDSRFVHIDRNPYEVLLSTFKFFKGFLKTLQLQDIDDDSLWSFIFQTYITLNTKYLENKHLISSQNLVEIKYEDLIADPEKVFQNLRKNMFSDLRTNDKKLRSLIQNHKTHQSNIYNFERKYIDLVNSELGNLIEDLGYKKL